MSEPDRTSQPQQALEPLLSVEEACELLNISSSTLYRLARRDDLAFVKVGGRTLFQRQALRDFIARNSSVSASPGEAA